MQFGLVVVAAWVLLTALWFILPTARADLYDLLISRTTAKWCALGPGTTAHCDLTMGGSLHVHRAAASGAQGTMPQRVAPYPSRYAVVLARVTPDSRILDIGIGTASALVRNQELVLGRRVTVVGIDPEREYVTKAARVVAAAGLADAVKVHRLSIYEPGLRSAFAGKAKFDHVYFSGSLTVLRDPVAALRCAATMLKPGGRVYVTQCFHNRPAPLMARLKPLLRRFTSIDFGRVVLAAEISELAERAGLHVIEDAPVPGSIDTRWQTARLVVFGLGSKG